MWWRNINIETRKSEKIVFGQISVSIYEDFCTVCAVKHFRNCKNKIGSCEAFVHKYINGLSPLTKYVFCKGKQFNHLL